jgi:dTDP-4-dehydrorhamnose reductase
LIKVFVTGGNGQLGIDLCKSITSLHDTYELYAPTRKVLDLRRFNDVEEQIINFAPDIIIHSAAYTDVAQAEVDKENCYQDNVLVTENLIKICKRLNCKLAFISTDFVFDGTLIRPYKVTDNTDPINYYGQTKLVAEQLIQQSLVKYYIIRTSWLFSNHSNNFLLKILNAAKTKPNLSVVTDEIGTPTSTIFLSKVLLDIIKDDIYGLYHVTNKGFCSRFDFASFILMKAKIDCEILPVDGYNLNSGVKRPKHTVLENNWISDKIIHQSWEEAVVEVLNQLE